MRYAAELVSGRVHVYEVVDKIPSHGPPHVMCTANYTDARRIADALNSMKALRPIAIEIAADDIHTLREVDLLAQD